MGVFFRTGREYEKIFFLFGYLHLWKEICRIDGLANFCAGAFSRNVRARKSKDWDNAW